MCVAESPASLSPGITGVVLTRDGERLIGKCLASLAFCSKLIVVDSGSTDATCSIAESYGAAVYFRAWDGFDTQFTYAQSLVTTEWFFILDQDEIAPELLGLAILDAVSRADAAWQTSHEGVPVAFSVGRKSWYFNRFMKHGGWYPDFILRVFRTGYVEFYQDAHIHYRPLGAEGRIDRANTEIIHYPYTSFFHQMAKLNTYAQQGADALNAEGRRGGISRGVLHGLWRFLRIYVLKKGFLDGRAGFLAACHGAIYAFLKYIRTLEADWGAPYDKDKK